MRRGRIIDGRAAGGRFQAGCIGIATVLCWYSSHSSSYHSPNQYADATEKQQAIVLRTAGHVRHTPAAHTNAESGPNSANRMTNIP